MWVIEKLFPNLLLLLISYHNAQLNYISNSNSCKVDWLQNNSISFTSDMYSLYVRRHREIGGGKS